MFIRILGYYFLYMKFISTQLGLFSYYLIKLNNVKANYYFLIVWLLVLFYFLTKYIYYIILIGHLYFLKKTYYFFIIKFWFGFFKIHPIAFYSLVVYYIYILKNNYFFLKLKNKYFVYFSMFSFFLGGYWNMFHLSSGLFWSNDSIEVILIVFIAIYTLILHKFMKNATFCHLSIFSLIMIILLIRFGYVYTKHNFFNIDNKFVKKLNFVIFIGLLTISSVCFLQSSKITLLNKQTWYGIYFYICIILYLNYLNFLQIKKFNKILLLLTYLTGIFYIPWITVRFKMIHLIAFLTVPVYKLFMCKYIKELGYYVILRNLRFNNYLQMYESKNFNAREVCISYYRQKFITKDKWWYVKFNKKKYLIN